MNTTQFQVCKTDLARTRAVQLGDAPLDEGDVRVRVEQFAYTANNITYAAFGDAMHYWQFFPVDPSAASEGWGVVPVWGFGAVEESRCDAVSVGERLYGYWPMASHAVLRPARNTATGFLDGAPHRSTLHPVYNQYLRCAVDPLHRPGQEGLEALLRPLFLTAWLIDDFLADQHFFGTTNTGTKGTVLLSSASSKTAFATASMLARRPEVEVVGLTSPGNVAFCESLGIYRRVVPYAEITSMAAEQPCVFVDFAGSGPLRLNLHRHFQRLAYSCAVGGTHVSELAGGRDLPGPKPVLFFAPAQAKQRQRDWGTDGFAARLGAAWHGFAQQVGQASPPWVQTEHHQGADAVAAVHQQVLTGRGDARSGHVLTL